MAFTIDVIAAYRRCNMASQFRFGYLAVINIKIKVSRTKTVLKHPVQGAGFTQSFPEM